MYAMPRPGVLRALRGPAFRGGRRHTGAAALASEMWLPGPISLQGPCIRLPEWPDASFEPGRATAAPRGFWDALEVADSQSPPPPPPMADDWAGRLATMAAEAEADPRVLAGVPGRTLGRLLALSGALGVPLGRRVVDAAVRTMLDEGTGADLEGPELTRLVHGAAVNGFITTDFTIMVGQRMVQPGVLDRLTVTDTVRLLADLCALNVTNEFLLEALAVHIARLSPKLTGGQIAEICGALATTPFRHEGLMAKLGARAAKAPLSAQEMVSLCAALARLREADRESLPSVILRATEPEVLATLSTPEAASLLASCAALGPRHSAAADGLLRRVREGLQTESLTCHALGDVAWALATMGRPDPDLMRRCASALAAREVSDFSPEAMRKICWGFAKQQVKAHALFHRLAECAVRPGVTETFTADQIADTLWAYGTLGPRDPELLRRFATHTLDPRTLRTLTADHVATIAWAFAVFAMPDAPLLGALALHAARPAVLKHFNEDTVSTLYWAYTTLGVDNTELFDALKKGQQEARVLAAVTFHSPFLRHALGLGGALLLGMYGMLYC